MEATRSQKSDAIAGLLGLAGYRYLLEDLDESQQDLAAAMIGAKTDAELLRLSRLWQVVYKVVDFLRDHPQHLRNEIEAEREAARVEGDEYETALPHERALLLRTIEQVAKTKVPKGR